MQGVCFPAALYLRQNGTLNISAGVNQLIYGCNAINTEGKNACYLEAPEFFLPKKVSKSNGLLSCLRYILCLKMLL